MTRGTRSRSAQTRPRRQGGGSSADGSLPAKTATRPPPITGPTAIPACRPIEARLFAHDRSSSDSTRLGIAARTRRRTAAPRSRIRTRARSTRFANTIKAKNVAEIASDLDHPPWRHEPSPSAPRERVVRSPATPNVEQEGQRRYVRRGVRCHTVSSEPVRGGAPGDGDEAGRRRARRTLNLVNAMERSAPRSGRSGAGRKTSGLRGGRGCGVAFPVNRWVASS